MFLVYDSHLSELLSLSSTALFHLGIQPLEEALQGGHIF